MTDEHLLERITAHAEMLASYDAIAEKFAEGLRKELPSWWKISVECIYDTLSYRVAVTKGQRTHVHEVTDHELSGLTKVGSYPAFLSGQAAYVKKQMGQVAPGSGDWYEAKGSVVGPLSQATQALQQGIEGVKKSALIMGDFNASLGGRRNGEAARLALEEEQAIASIKKAMKEGS